MGRNKERNYSGPVMTGLQYEALCRYVISRLYGVAVEQIRSGYVSGPSQRRQELRHQIDLYWEASDGVCEYTVFADAKWRTHSVQVGDLMGVIGVWRDIGFHKAMIITNSGFDRGVIRQAEAKGIALLVVRPVADFSGLGKTDLPAVVEEVVAIAKGREEEEVFSMEVVHKGVGEWGRGRGGEGETSGAARAGEQGSSGAVEGGIWVIGGGDDSGEIEGVEDKAMGAVEIRNKMM